MTKVSHSQITDFQKCHRRFYYSHVLKLAPLDLPVAMEKGLGGHEIMESLLTFYKEGMTYEEAINKMTEEVVIDLAAANSPGLDVYRHCLAFFDFFIRQDWEPVEIEFRRMHEIDDEVTFVYTPDVIYRFKSGPRKGRKGMLDFKFTGQYWTQKEIELYQQQPKYAHYYQKDTDDPIVNASVVMLNTRAGARATGDDLFRISHLDLNKVKVKNIVRAGEDLAHQVADAKENWKESDFHRVSDPYQCKMCWFAEDICPQDLSGIDTTKTRERFYKINDYFDKYEEMNKDG